MSNTRRTSSINGIFSRTVARNQPIQKSPTQHISSRKHKKKAPYIPNSHRVSKHRDAKSASRKEKYGFLRRKGQRSNGLKSIRQQFLEDFTGSVDHTRREIASEAARTLSSTQEILESHLKDLIASHAARFALYQSHRNMLAAIPAPPDSDMVAGVKSAAVELGKSVAAQKQVLYKLWRRWERVQQKIVCLATEVLGSGVLGVGDGLIEGAEIKGGYKKRLDKALIMNEKQVTEDMEAKDVMEKLKGKVKWISSDFRAKTRDIEKKTKEEKKKQREGVYMLAQKMLSSI